MRFIKLAILSFVLLFLVVTVISLFIPGNISISRAMNIAADDSSTFNLISNLEDWKLWHPALKDLPESEIDASTDSILVKNTIIKVVKRKEDELLTEMSVIGGRPIDNGFKLIRHEQRDSSTIQTFMNFHLHWYPWEKFRSLFYENIYGTQMEQGLANLRQLNRDATRQ